MTVTTTVKKVNGNGNGSAFTFPFTGLELPDAADQIEVTFVDTAGTETLLSEGVGPTNYSVTMVDGFPGTGSVTYPADSSTPMASGEKIVMRRAVDQLQGTDLGSQKAYDPDQVELQFDRIVMMVLQLQEELNRSIKLQVGDDSGADLSIPAPSANKIIGWDAAGTALTNYVPNTDTYVSLPLPVASGGTGATTQEAARAALGLIIGTDVQAELDVPDLAEAQAGTATTERVWTAERVGQAITALTPPAITQAVKADIENQTNENTYVPPDLLKYHPGIAKVWGRVTDSAGTPTLETGSYGMTSVTDGAAGETTLTFAASFSSVHYSMLAVAEEDDITTQRNVSVEADTKAVGSCVILSRNFTPTAIDVGFNFVAFGDQ